MKTKLITLTSALLLTALTGCISLPPLVRVEHKHSADNDAVAKRLDSIDQRLGTLEQKGKQQ